MRIFRYVPLKFIKKILQTKSLYFSNVLNWEDPYECFLFKQRIFTESGGDFKNSGFCPVYFGQCWTTRKESDAMWRIYSVKSKDLKQDKEKLEDVAIKIEIESVVLEKNLQNLCRYNTEKKIECREVIYTDSDYIKDAIKNIHQMNFYNIQDLMLKSLFYKRKSFEHECEYRFIVQVPPQEVEPQASHMMIDFDATAIKEYIADPRLSDEQFQRIKSELVSLKVDEYKIKKSKLYHPIERIEICVEKHGLINNNSYQVQDEKN